MKNRILFGGRKSMWRAAEGRGEGRKVAQERAIPLAEVSTNIKTYMYTDYKLQLRALFRHILILSHNCPQ